MVWTGCGYGVFAKVFGIASVTWFFYNSMSTFFLCCTHKRKSIDHILCLWVIAKQKKLWLHVCKIIQHTKIFHGTRVYIKDKKKNVGDTFFVGAAGAALESLRWQGLYSPFDLSPLWAPETAQAT